MQTKAALLSAPRAAVRVDSIELPAPGPGEVLIEVEACGICHSDLFVAGLEKLRMTPLILGHEAIGRVRELGPGAETAWLGKRVGITFLGETCGACELCREGRERYCARQTNHGFSRHGALSNWTVARTQHLAHVPESLDAAAAAPLCCAGWTALGALREAGLAPASLVAIFGFGGLGHLALAAARHQGAHCAIADPQPAKQEMARGLGAEFVYGADAARHLQKETGGADAALVLTASPAAIEQAFRSLKRNGRLVLVGLAQASYTLPLVETVLKGIEVRGSYLGTPADLEEAFTLQAAGVLAPHIETHALDAAPELLARLERGEIPGRAVVCF